MAGCRLPAAPQRRDLAAPHQRHDRGARGARRNERILLLARGLAGGPGPRGDHSPTPRHGHRGHDRGAGDVRTRCPDPEGRSRTCSSTSATSRPCAGSPSSWRAGPGDDGRVAVTTPSWSAPGPTDSWPPTSSPTPAGTCWCSRRRRRPAAPCAATARCTRTSSTTPSARSTPWPWPPARSPRLRLEEHGLAWEHAPAVLGHPFGDGQWAVLHRDRDLTAAGLDALHAGDGDAWLRSAARGTASASPLVDALTSPFPPVRAGARLMPRLVRERGAGHGADARHAGRRRSAASCSAAPPPACCWRATPGTPTSRSPPPARASSAC